MRIVKDQVQLHLLSFECNFLVLKTNFEIPLAIVTPITVPTAIPTGPPRNIPTPPPIAAPYIAISLLLYLDY